MTTRWCGVLLALAISVTAQTPPAPPPQLPPLAGLTVTGSARFTPDQLVTASGLQLHQAVSLDFLNQAVRRLRATGEFTRVTYRYEYTAEATTVQFEVTDQKQMLPVEFDNFVWLPADQLLALLRAQVPLFTGEVPFSGGVDQSISAALEAWLHQHGMAAATVQGLPLQDEMGGPISSYMFAVSGIKIPVQQIAFVGVPPELVAALQKKAADLIGTDFSWARLKAAAHYDFLPVLQNRGFLQGAFATPTVAISDAANNGVSVSVAVTPGTQYRWGAVSFAGNTAFDSKKLGDLAKLKPGDVADQSALDQDQAAIQKLYRGAGYLQAAVTPQYVFADSTAAATITVTEGPQFHMGEVSFEGVTTKSAAEMAKLWKLAPGQPFSPDYLDQYLRTLSQTYNLANADIHTTMKEDAQRQVVDLIIKLSPHH